MDTVKLKRDELLAVIKTNREAHRKIFLEALDGFRARVIQEFERRLDDARNGRAINVQIGLPHPVDQTKDYDRVIRMLEMSIDTEIELAQNEFAQYVMDDWSWKQNFTVTNSAYLVQR